MEKADIKTIKEVNGRKVIHPFRAGPIVYSFFSLLLVAFPVCMLFVPLVMFGGFNPELSFKGIELLMYYPMGLINGEVPPDGMYGLLVPTAGNDAMFQVCLYIMMGQAVCLALIILFGIIALIVAIVSFSKGYLKAPRGIKGLAVAQFVFTIIFTLPFIFYYVLNVIYPPDPAFAQWPWFAFIPFGASLIILIAISIAYTAIYSDCLYESDLVFNEDESTEVVTTHVTEVHEVTKVNYEQATTLPPDITSIGGHEFSSNQTLQVANIPIGITVLGNSAFSNCLKLRVVSLPDSVKEIGFNCFFNCVSLERLNYAGTKEQWRHIKRGSNWLAKAKTTEVVCADGPIIVNPYR